MNKKCLIIDPMHESLFPLLEKIGWEGVYKPDLIRDEIRSALSTSTYSGLIVRSKTRIDKDLLGKNSSLRFIGRAGAGIDNIDVSYIESQGIVVIHAAEGNRDAVGEHTVGLLLCLLRNISKADQEVRKFEWKREENRGMEIMGKTIGIIGYGNMGSAFARRLAGFECKVLAYDKNKRGYSNSVCTESRMEELYEACDIVSLHIPLTSETRMMVNLSFLDRFKKNFILINTSRGEIVSLTDLEAAIKKGKVLGAALDVLENEKLNELTSIQAASFDSLSRRANVIFTPHIAGWTFESHHKINVALVEKLEKLNFEK